MIVYFGGCGEFSCVMVGFVCVGVDVLVGSFFDVVIVFI